MKPILLALALSAGLMLSGCRSTSELEVVSGFELSRYLGLWYEAARFPHRFEKDLTSVTAEYTMNEDGSVRVLNRGYNPEDGQWKTADGIARLRKNPEEGWLKVSFFRPFYADYKILHLDTDYQEAIVTGPTFDYLWILVRNPALPEQDLERLIRIAQGFGFDTNRIERVDQSPDP